MPKEMYAEDKPSDCNKCYFWNRKKQDCSLGKKHCYYLLTEKTKVKSECDGCPYGRAQPCIGWCTRKILCELGM